MDAYEFREVLNWWMCSDPFPDGASKDVIDSWLEREARERGYNGVVAAFHEHSA